MLEAAYPRCWHSPRAGELLLVPCIARNQCEQAFEVAWVRLDHILIAAVAEIGVTAAAAAAADSVVVAGNAAAAAAGHHMIFADFEHCSKPARSAQRNQSLCLRARIRMYQH